MRQGLAGELVGTKLEDEYSIGRELGKGAFAIVRAAVRHKPVAGASSEVPRTHVP